jgi:hypothetical protein
MSNYNNTKKYSHHVRPAPSVIRNKLIKRQISSTNPCFVPIDPTDPTRIESNYELVQEYAPNGKNTPELDKYFEDKIKSVNEFYREQSNSAAAAGTPAKDMEKFINERDHMLAALESQKEDLEEMDYNPTNPAEYDFDSSSESSNSETDSPVEQAGQAGQAGQESGETGSNDTSYQDSSDVVQTSFDPSDYYDD